jgi:hypothetical protein
MDSIKIVKYQKSDYLQFRDFVRTAFHSKYILSDERFLDWQYPSTGSGNDGMLMLAKIGDEIAGFFGYKDFDYKIYGETKKIRAVMNLFAAEKYRMAGIGPRLAEAVFGKDGYILVSSYNDAAQKLYRHFRPEWTEAGDLKRYFAVFGEHKLLEGFRREIATSKTPRNDGRGAQMGRGSGEVSSLSERGDLPAGRRGIEVGEEFDEFWQRVRDRYPVTIERGSEYLNWRFLRHPFFDYQFLIARKDGKLAGFLVYRFENVDDFKIARIIDFVAEESAEMSLLSEFLKRAQNEKAQAADFMFSGSLYDDSLKQAGFFDVRGTDFAKFPIRFSPLSYSKFVINIAYDLSVPLQDFYLTKADSDQDRPNPY